MANTQQKADKTYTVVEKFFIEEDGEPRGVIILTDDSDDSKKEMQYKPSAIQFLFAEKGDKFQRIGNNMKLIIPEHKS